MSSAMREKDVVMDVVVVAVTGLGQRHRHRPKRQHEAVVRRTVLILFAQGKF